MTNKFVGYFALKDSDESRLPSFAFGDEAYVRCVVAKWNDDKRKTTEDLDEKDPAEIDEFSELTHTSALTDALKASVDFGINQYQLINAASIAPILMEMGMANSEIINPTKKESTFIEKIGNTAIYGLLEHQFSQLIKSEQKFTASVQGMKRFPSAVFLSIIATFDTLIVDILFSLLNLQSDWLEKSDRVVSLGRISNAKSLEELISEQISEELYQFSRESHAKQASYIARNFGVDVKKDWDRWPDYIEVFERRNLVAHGEKRFNKRYVDICTAEGLKDTDKILDQEVFIPNHYIKNSLYILIEFSLLLSFSLFRKLAKENEKSAFETLNRAAFRLIQNGLYLPADRICEFALRLKNVQMSEEVRRMLIVNRASALRHGGGIETAIELLNNEDWSAVSDKFKICVASVKGDIDSFLKLLDVCLNSNVIDSHSLLTWPCFSFMISNDDTKRRVYDALGITLDSKTVEDSTNVEPKQNASGSNADDSASH